jgi:phosphoribosylglycinamide formyltransferase-1
MTKLAVLISGQGTNLKTISEFCKNNPDKAQIAVVISNKEDVGGLEIAKEFGIKTVVAKTAGRKMEDFEADILEYLQNVDLICLAGFMRVLTPQFVNHWREKIINIHPSLLPAFKGANAIADALNYGVKITGCTVHFVVPEIDSGKIIYQVPVEILPNDTFETLKKCIHESEKICYTKALESVL